jgi:hypothetical protein
VGAANRLYRPASLSDAADVTASAPAGAGTSGVVAALAHAYGLREAAIRHETTRVATRGAVDAAAAAAVVTASYKGEDGLAHLAFRMFVVRMPVVLG